MLHVTYMSGTIRVINTTRSVAANGKYSYKIYLSLVAIKFRSDETQEQQQQQQQQQQQELSNKKQLG